MSSDKYLKLLSTPAELHPELKERLIVRKDLGMPGIYHPLYYSIPHAPELNHLANLQFEMKKKALAEYKQKKKWSSYIFIYERPYRIQAFMEIMSELDDQKYWTLLGEVWADSENIWQNLEAWTELLSSRRAGREHFMDEQEREAFAKLPEKLVVYRGYEHGKNRVGLSWTLSAEKAAWFSKRYNRNGKVRTRTIKKSDVFAYLTGRGEDEIVLKISALK